MDAVFCTRSMRDSLLSATTTRHSSSMYDTSVKSAALCGLSAVNLDKTDSSGLLHRLNSIPMALRRRLSSFTSDDINMLYMRSPRGSPCLTPPLKLHRFVAPVNWNQVL